MLTRANYWMPASAGDLRMHILDLTGYDLVTEPAFEWSIVMWCDGCHIADCTAIVNVTGDFPERLCAHCLEARL